jgi:tetratricopeptide (TPR) repeat protein
MFPQNPYIVGNSVGDSPAFVGRANVLREVVRILRHPHQNAIVLFGQRRIGKTSVLQELDAKLFKEDYYPIYFDLQDKAQWPLKQVLQELALEISDVLQKGKPDLGAFPETTFHEVWLPDVLNNLPPEKSLVLLFDEFDVLDDPKSEQAGAVFFPYLRDNLLSIDLQRLNFVFVIGRKIDDLNNIVLSLFKSIPTKRVSLLHKEDTVKLVRLSENNQTLNWADDAIEKVWQLTNGHPYLTQCLCSRVWENIHDKSPDKAPPVILKDIEIAIPDTIAASYGMLAWLWGGLPPAERVVASALASAGEKVMTEIQLEHLLKENGVQMMVRELQNAPRLLQDWDLIEPDVGGGYRFRVELLRRWIAEHKPISQVQDELDRIEPVAQAFYEAGRHLYANRLLEEALDSLRQAVSLNQNHTGANLLLADILIAQNQADEASEILEQLYKYQPVVTRPKLIQALLILAQISDNEDEQLKFYERVLSLEPKQLEAKSGQQKIWQQRGDETYNKGDFKDALDTDSSMKLKLLKKICEMPRLMGEEEIVLTVRMAKEWDGTQEHICEALDLTHGSSICRKFKPINKDEEKILKKFDSLYAEYELAIELCDIPPDQDVKIRMKMKYGTYEKSIHSQEVVENNSLPIGAAYLFKRPKIIERITHEEKNYSGFIFCGIES